MALSFIQAYSKGAAVAHTVPQATRWFTARLGFAKTMMATLLLGFYAGSAQAEWGLNLPPPSTPIAREIMTLHNWIMVICLVIFIVVFGFMFYSLYAHRKSKGFKAAQFSHSTTMEIVWTIIPFLILVGMAIPSTATLLRMEDTTDADLTVKITGYQWKWEYEYLGHDVSFFSNLSTPRAQIEGDEEKTPDYLLNVDNPMVIPANRKVRLLFTSNDVIHAWWIPKFGVKKDAIPGYLTETWVNVEEAGTYRGQCAELCGKDHGFMPIVAEVMEPEQFDQWLAEQSSMQMAVVEADEKAVAEGLSKDELMSRGEQVYAQCVACHQADGSGVQGAFPAITGSPVATGPVNAHIDLILNGKPDTAMVAFGPQLSDSDIAAVITYQRNALGNNTGEVVQPAEIKARR